MGESLTMSSSASSVRSTDSTAALLCWDVDEVATKASSTSVLLREGMTAVDCVKGDTAPSRLSAAMRDIESERDAAPLDAKVPC